MTNLMFGNSCHKEFVDSINGEYKKYKKEGNLKNACSLKQHKEMFQKYLEKKKSLKEFMKTRGADPVTVGRIKEGINDFRDQLIRDIMKPFIDELCKKYGISL